jgi:hypothetical protein
MVNQSTTETVRRVRRPIEVRHAELREKLMRMESREIDRICKQLRKASEQMKDLSAYAAKSGNPAAAELARSIAEQVDQYVASTGR